MRPGDIKISADGDLHVGRVSYFIGKAFTRAMKDAFLQGGQAQKKHDKIRIVLGSLETDDPFLGLPVTKHGEKRIRHCVKYNLGDGWRLVTQQNDKVCTFLFMGNHDETGRWLDGHQGENIGIQANRLVRVPGVGSQTQLARGRTTDQHDRPLIDLLRPDEADNVLGGLIPSLVRQFAALDGRTTAADLEMCLALVPDPHLSEFLRSVFILLLAGNIDGAQAHVDLRMGKIAPLAEVGPEETVDVEDGEDIRRLRVGSFEYEVWLTDFQKRSPWHDWFLFLHPQQEKVVEADYPGIAQLSGVSGSGKTCVVVRRAIRLAGAGTSRVLLLTLNRSLAGLLRQLVDAACTDAATRSRIEVTSFFGLARTLLVAFEPDKALYYEDETWKTHEHVDEVFREYYRQWSNNRDASILLSHHKSLNTRGVAGETYTREEFDWIRSALTPDRRSGYLTVERKGRKFPITAERRSDLLYGLEGWERKMSAVGVIDYLGLTSALARHLNKIVPAFTNVLVDEAQDFGTTELSVIRRLVAPGPNDVFLCGDIAQTVLPKHRSVHAAGFHDPVRERIQQNYRNSREILAAAYDLLQQNLHEDMFESEDLEILDPRFANFGGPVPMALAAESLAEEIAFARSYSVTRLKQDAKTVCVAFAGFSSRDIGRFARRWGITALDGNYDPGTDALVFSDLEQTKGYEFDCLVIVNCCEGVLPASDAPAEEAFRETCKLYVAMTRAKRELILSFHGAASRWIRAVGGTIETDAWASYEEHDPTMIQCVPEVLSEVEGNTYSEDVSQLTGAQFLYTTGAIGLSNEAQDKLIEMVDGRGATAAVTGRRVRWANIGALRSDLKNSRRQDGLLGYKVAEEIRAVL